MISMSLLIGNKVKLQHNDITGIATWKDGRTTYYGVSIEDLLLIYEEFGLMKMVRIRSGMQ